MVLRKLFLDVGSTYKKNTEPTSVVFARSSLYVRGQVGVGVEVERGRRERLSHPVMTVSPEGEK